jgi:DNA-binding NarL/FixJ family response regulator
MKLIPTLDETDNRIIELLLEGFSSKDIAHKIWKSQGSVRKRLHNLRKHYQCDTTQQLIIKLLKEVA